MLIIPKMVGKEGMETWFSTLEDALLLAVLATPLIVKWSLKGFPLERKFLSNSATFRFSVFNIGIAIFSVVFSIECGIMLAVPLVGLTNNTISLASFDAGFLALFASPIVYLILTIDPNQIYSFSDSNKMRNVRRQFIMLFLPQLILFTFITESIYFQDTRAKDKVIEIENVKRIDFIKDHLSLEITAVANSLLGVARRSTRYLSQLGRQDAENMILEDMSNLLEIEKRFSQAFFINSQGVSLLHLSFQNGQIIKNTPGNNDFAKLPALQSLTHGHSGDVLITRPQTTATDQVQNAPVLQFGTRVMDNHGNMMGMIFLEYLWNDIVALLNKDPSIMFGQISIYSDSNQLLYSFPSSAKVLPVSIKQWTKITNTESGQIEDGGEIIFFTTLQYGPAPETVQTNTTISSPMQNDSAQVMSSWKIISRASPEGHGAQNVFFLNNLLIFQALLISLSAIGSWLFSQAIVNRREADSRNERAHQSRITLSSLLETSLVPMNMENQLRAALQIVSTTPWVGLTGKGAIFLTDHESEYMKLAAHTNLNNEELHQVRRISTSRCLCHQSHDSRKIFCLPTDVPDHVLCLKSERGQGNYCIPLPGVSQPIGVMYMQLKKGIVSRDTEAFLSTMAYTISGIIERRNMEVELHSKHIELKKTRLDIIHRLGMAAEYRDQETGLHVVRMSKYAALLAKAAGFSDEFCDIITNAAPMHDVGKIGIPDHVLLKPNRLTNDEWEIMKKHTLIGSTMLHGYDAEPMNTAHIIALTHHERWDGTGYPIGVPREEIPIEGRICAIADVFDALTSDRPYKKAWSPEESLQEIIKGSGSAFDPHLVSVFVDIFPDIIAIKLANSDE
ncbi:MAG: HD domain-containing protein [Magnetococcales bacterium]|nr:HD domain-containing protein [Magnetococcales bacterium]